MALHTLILSLDGGMYRASGGTPSPAGPLQVVSIRVPAAPQAPVVAQPEVMTERIPAQQENNLPEAVVKRPRESQSMAPGAPASQGLIKYYARSELNRYPVLLTPLPTKLDDEAGAELLLRPGLAVFRLFINAEGEVVTAELEESSLPEGLTRNARQRLMKAKFMPGYWMGDPVPVMLRWQVEVSPNLRLPLSIREFEAK